VRDTLEVVHHLQRLQSKVLSLVVWLSYFLILVTRGRFALDRIPSDQGYGIFESARQGFRVEVFLVPYMNLITQSIPYLIAPLPISTHAVAASLLVHAIWATCGLIIFLCFRLIVSSLTIACLAGLAMILVPYMSESSLGNPGMVGFALLTTSIVISAIPSVIRSAPRTSTTIGLIAGLTSPLGFLAVIPTLFRALRHRILSGKEWTFVMAVLLSLFVNIGLIGVTGAASGRGNKVLVVWSGAGAFWWSGLLGPPAIAVGVLLFLFIRRRLNDLADTAVGLALGSVSTATLAYYLGGIADRYFVTPAALAALSVLVLILSMPETRHSSLIRWIAVPGVSLLLMVPAAKWFSAGWYLTSGPTWSSEVERAESICRSASVTQVQIQISPSGTHSLRCSYLVGNE